MEKSTAKGYELLFKNLSVSIGKRDILRDVSGVAEPGEMMAIMGPSGAGKTTLLNCLAGRRSIDSGSITMNSRLINKQLRRKISFVLQNDIFLSELTCWETIWYTALLRLPGSMPVEEKKRQVNEVIDALDMRKCLNTKVGDAGHGGLSGGERKRTTIACELLTNPALMLLDEPTSGLDSSTAYNLCLTIKQFAKISGKTVIMTIHQPSSKIFSMFDKLTLLCDGQVAYYGRIEHCASFFSGIDLPCPVNYNLADHILDQVKENEDIKERIIRRAVKQREELTYPKQLTHGSSINVTIESSLNESAPENNNSSEKSSLLDINKYFRHSLSHESETMRASVEQVYIEDEKSAPIDTGTGLVVFNDTSLPYEYSDSEWRFRKEYEAKWPTGFWIQYNVLLRRAFWQAVPRILSRWNALQVTITAIFGGLLWFKIEPKEEAIADRQGLIFFTLIFTAFYALIDAMLSFPSERIVLNKERLAGYYRLSAYYFAKICSDIPLILILPTVFVALTFWMSALNLSFYIYIQIQGCMIVSSVLAHSIGVFYSTLILDVPVSMMCSTTTMLVLTLAGGYYARNVPFWMEWLKYCSFTQHLFYAILIIDFENIDIRCSAAGSHYTHCITQYNSTLPLNSTVYIPQQALLDEFTLTASGWKLWHHLAVNIMLIIIARVSAYLVLRFIRKPHIA